MTDIKFNDPACFGRTFGTNITYQGDLLNEKSKTKYYLSKICRLILRLPDHTYITLRIFVSLRSFVFSLFLCMVMHVEGVGQTASSLSFSSDLVTGLHMSLTDQEKRETIRSLGEGGEKNNLLAVRKLYESRYSNKNKT